MRSLRRPRRGQSLIEFAFVASLLLLLLGGVLDLGTLLSGHLAIVGAARQGALVGASAGTSTLADCEVLAAVFVGTQGHTGLTITRVIIYQSDENGAPVGGNFTIANIYAGNPGCTNPSSPPTPSTNGWPPTSRNASYYNANSLGVRIEYTYAWQTSFISTGNLSVSDQAIMPITPS